MNATELATKLMDIQRKTRLEARSKLWRPSATPATDLGHECDRRIVYHRTQPEMAASISEELASIFTEGNLHQEQVRRELSELGFEVVEAERNFRDDRLQISGTIDGMFQDPDDFRVRIPLEIKSWSGDVKEDLSKSDKKLLKKYVAQMQTYLFLTSNPVGILLFKNKMTGLWWCHVVELDYELAEELLQRAERVRDHVAAGTMPARLLDRSECKTCPWKDTVCHPEEESPDPILLAQDEDLVDQLRALESLEPLAKEHGKLDKLVKDRFKMTAGDEFVVGDAEFRVTKRPHGKGIRVLVERLADF